MTPKETAQRLRTANAFRGAAKILRRGQRAFICSALALYAGPGFRAARAVIRKRMYPHATLEIWLVRRQYELPWEDRTHVMREYRLAWLAALIDEFDPPKKRSKT